MRNQNRNKSIQTILITMFVAVAVAAGCGGGKSSVAPSFQDNMRVSERKTSNNYSDRNEGLGERAGFQKDADASPESARLQALYEYVNAMDESSFTRGEDGKEKLLRFVAQAQSMLKSGQTENRDVVNFVDNTIMKFVSAGEGGEISVSDPAVQVALTQQVAQTSTTVTCGGIVSVDIAAAVAPVVLRAGETAAFTATGYYAESACGSVDLTADAAWTSTLPSVAGFVTAPGELTAVNPGAAFISAAAYGVNSANQIAVTVEVGCDQVVFPDPGLEAVVRADAAFTGQPTGTICVEDVAAIKLLTLDGVLTTGDLSGIENLTALRTLYLQRNNLTDISPLAALPELRKVILNYNNITDLTPLSGAYWLVNLSAVGNGIADISPLAGISNLLTVNLSNNYISDVTALGRHVRILTLALENNMIADISPLAALPKVEELRLDNNRIADISPLAGSASLKILSVSNNQVTDLQAVTGLYALNTLAVSKNGLANIAPVAALGGLTNFIAENNRIADISPLAGLSLLKNVVLNGNLVSDVAPLQNLTGISFVGLGSNKVTDVAALTLNAGVGAGDQVVLTLNPLSTAALSAQIPDLLSKGVTVTY